MAKSKNVSLTKRLIEAAIVVAPSKPSETWIWDSRVIGLGVRVKPSGRATYTLVYRNREGRKRKLAIGSVSTFSVDSARREAMQYLADIKGIKRADPASERKSARDAMTVSELCDTYLRASSNRIRGSTLAADKSRIEIHVKPHLGARKVAGITPADIENLTSAIAEGRTTTKLKRIGRGGNARGGKAVAIRTARMLSVIFKRAVRDGQLASNPVSLVSKPSEDRYRPNFKWANYAALGAALRSLRTAGTNARALDAIELLALTGARRSEIYDLKWSSVDLNGRCLHLQQTKTVPQLRPIGEAAIAKFKSLTRAAVHVFPNQRLSTKGTEVPFAGTNKVWQVVRKRAGLDGLHLHGLRHFYATAAHDMGYSKFIVAGLLGHSMRGDTERYVGLVDTTLLEAADKISTRIKQALFENYDHEGPSPIAAVFELRAQPSQANI